MAGRAPAIPEAHRFIEESTQMLGTQKGFTMIGRGNAEMLRSIAQDYDNRETALVALAEAFDAQWNVLSGLEPESVVERRLYNAICVAIGLPPRCEIEEDRPPTAVEEYAAWLERQPKPRAWKKVTEKRYDEMLGAVPPAIHTPYGFLVGEPYDQRKCQIHENVCFTYRPFLTDGTDFYEGEPMTLAEFRSVVERPHKVAAALRDAV